MTPPLNFPQKRVLNKLVLKDRNFVGRDALWKLVSIKFPKSKISRRQVMDYIKKSETHQLYKQKRKTKHIKPTILKQPFGQIGIDLIDMTSFESKGFKWILTAIDMFSRYTWVEALKSKKSNIIEPEVVNAMKKIISRMKEKPHSLRSDNGSEFISGEFQGFLKNKKIRHQFSSAETPASNGMIERYNGKLKRQLQMIRTQEDDTDWTSYLQQVNTNLNNTYHRVIKMTPNELHTHKTQYTKGYENIKKEASKRTWLESQDFNLKDIVRIKRKEGDDYNFSKQTYEIVKVRKARQITGRTTYNVKKKDGEMMKTRFYNEDLQKITGIDIKAKEPTKYLLSSIKTPLVENGIKYLVLKFTNKPETIEPYDSILKDAPKMVRAFEKKHKVRWLKDKETNSFNL